MFTPIYSEEEHNRILFELGLLDDMEDWSLFLEQKRKFGYFDDIDLETWAKYVNNGNRYRGVVPIGRTAVSKTECWGFESLHPCIETAD